jgi:hypothetical protein
MMSNEINSITDINAIIFDCFENILPNSEEKNLFLKHLKIIEQAWPIIFIYCMRDKSSTSIIKELTFYFNYLEIFALKNKYNLSNELPIASIKICEALLNSFNIDSEKDNELTKQILKTLNL